MDSFCPHCEKITHAGNVISTLTFTIKGVDVSVDAPLLKCGICGNEFEDAEADIDVADMALSAYREKVGLLAPGEIREFRSTLGLTQQELSRILGWGAATLSRYENGALQDEAHDRALRLVMRPDSMLSVLERSPDLLGSDKRARLLKQLRSRENAESAFKTFFSRFVTDYGADIFSGYRRFDRQKFFAMILHFCRDGSVPRTKLNKLLWYSDFLYFKKNTVSISGMKYAHLPYGPAPDKYDLFLAFLTEIDRSLTVDVKGSGAYTWEVLAATRAPDYSVFSNSELHVLTLVASTFQDTTARSISDISHEEKGYASTVDGQMISYEYADDLTGVA